MSYELVDWLAKRLQFPAEWLEQEYKDHKMIQKAMLGDMELEDERELQRDSKQTTLLEFHMF